MLVVFVLVIDFEAGDDNDNAIVAVHPRMGMLPYCLACKFPLPFDLLLMMMMIVTLLLLLLLLLMETNL